MIILHEQTFCTFFWQCLISKLILACWVLRQGFPRNLFAGKCDIRFSMPPVFLAFSKQFFFFCSWYPGTLSEHSKQYNSDSLFNTHEIHKNVTNSTACTAVPVTLANKENNGGTRLWHVHPSPSNSTEPIGLWLCLLVFLWTKIKFSGTFNVYHSVCSMAFISLSHYWSSNMIMLYKLEY